MTSKKATKRKRADSSGVSVDAARGKSWSVRSSPAQPGYLERVPNPNPPNPNPSDLDIVMNALCGSEFDQACIADIGIRWLATIIRKNRDYGSAVWNVPVLSPNTDAGTAILVRMSDKISRLERLLAGNRAEVESETIADTLGDLGSYCLLYLARPMKTDEEEID